MHSRPWLYVTALSIGAFAIGICTTAILRWPVVNPATYLLLVGVIIATRVHTRRTHDSGRPRAHTLLCDIHRQVALLTQDGYVSLVPRPDSDDHETKRLLIGVDHNGTAYVEQLGWSGALRRYSITEDGGIVRRSVASDTITEPDYAWCHGDLTDEQLERLLSRLTGAYLPVKSVAFQ